MIRRTKLKGLVAAAAAMAVVLSGCSGGGDDAASGLRKFTLTNGAANVPLSLAYLAHEQGYFKDEGLDVNLTLTAGQVINSLVSGQADAVSSGAPAPLIPVAQGVDTQIIYGTAGGGASASLAGRSGITDINDCKRVAVASAGNAGYAWAVTYQKLLGVKWDLIEFNDFSQIIPSVVSKQNDCGIPPPGYMTAAVDEDKVKVLIDSSDPASQPADFPTGMLEGNVFALSSEVKKNPNDYAALIRGLERARKFAATASSVELAKIVHKNKDFKVYTLDQLTRQFDSDRGFIAPNDGRVSEESWPGFLEFQQDAGLKVLKGQDLSDPKWSYANRVNMEFLDESKK